MEYLVKKYSDISGIDRKGIIFKNGDKILFEECIGNCNYSETCVSKRDIVALPPYFEFFTPNKPTRIIFNKTGFFSKRINEREFVELQMDINSMGYSTFDLS